jgi:hypothetical protein
MPRCSDCDVEALRSHVEKGDPIRRGRARRQFDDELLVVSFDDRGSQQLKTFKYCRGNVVIASQRVIDFQHPFAASHRSRSGSDEFASRFLNT